VERFFGPGRIETAIAISRASHPGTGTTPAVVLARADDYADALAGGPLASTLQAPVLLTDSGGLPAVVAAEIDRLGAEQAVLLGGRAALSDQVEADLRAAGVSEIRRIDGATRYDTARLVAQQVGGQEPYVVEGAHADPSRGWPDAVSVSALASSQRRPILLVEAGRLPDETAQALADLDATAATVVGGTVAVSQAVFDTVADQGVDVTRVSGGNRYETSLAVAGLAAEAGDDPAHAWFATGRNFPDALAAGPAVATMGGVLLLVDGRSLNGSPEVREWLDGKADVLRRVTLVGGDAAISFTIEDELREGLRGEAGPAD
jgi:putative cell wall-binding protein